MKRVFKGGALVALIAILIAPAVYADDPLGPPDPPEARIRIPVGVAGQQEPSARMRPPAGSEAQREQSIVFGLFRAWLQARFGIPIG
jgi:hypothetical protein